MIRIRNLEADIGSQPLLKNFLGDLIGGIANIITGATAASASRDNNESNIQAQREENEKNRQWQSDEWTRQFNMTNEYNDPSAVVSRLRNAGINPQIALGQNGTKVGQSSATPSAPSGASNLGAQMVDYSGFFNTVSQFPKVLAEAAKAWSESKKIREEIPFIGEQMSANIQQMLSDSRYNSVRAEMEQFNLDLEKEFGRSHRSASLQKLLADTQMTYANTKVAEAEEALKYAQEFRETSQALLNYAKKNLSERQAAELDIVIKNKQRTIDEYVKTLRSQQSSNYASAAHERALAKTEDDFRGLRKSILDNDVRFSTETYFDRIDKLRNELDNQSLLNDQSREILKKLKFCTDVQAFDYWFNQFKSVVKLGMPVSSDVPASVVMSGTP